MDIDDGIGDEPIYSSLYKHGSFLVNMDKMREDLVNMGIDAPEGFIDKVEKEGLDLFVKDLF